MFIQFHCVCICVFTAAVVLYVRASVSGEPLFWTHVTRNTHPSRGGGGAVTEAYVQVQLLPSTQTTYSSDCLKAPERAIGALSHPRGV